MAQKKDAPSVADCLRKTLSKCPVWACTFALTLFSLSAVSQTAEDVEDAADFLDASVEMVKSAPQPATLRVGVYYSPLFTFRTDLMDVTISGLKTPCRPTPFRSFPFRNST